MSPTLLLPLLCMLATAPGYDIETFELKNGLDVIVHHDPSLPRVYVELVYKVGSADEGPGKSGFAHLFEHLMFEGSKNVPEGAFDEWLEAAGGENNAWTGYDRTTYYEVVPKNALELTLFLEADRMAGLLEGMGDDVVDGQREVVRNERRQRHEVRPYGQVGLVVPGALYPEDHPYHQPVIGSHHDLAAASADDVRAFFRRHYTPANASLLIAGDVEPEEARRLVERWFGPIEARPAPAPAQATGPLLPSERKLVLEDDVELPKLILSWPSPAFFAPGDAALDVAADVLADGRTSRLRRRLVDELGLARSVTAWQASYRLGGHFDVEVLAKPGVDLDRVLAVVDEEVASLAADGPRDEELLIARRGLEVSFLDDAERLQRRASRMHTYALHLGHPDRFAEDLERYRSLTPAEVARAVGDTLIGPRVVLSVVPRGQRKLSVAGSAEVPPEPPAPPSGEVRQPQGRPPPEVAPPAPGPAASVEVPSVVHQKVGELDVRRVARPETGLFDLRVSIAGGAELDPPGREGLVYLAAEMAGRGAGGFDAPAFEAAAKRLGATLDVWADWDTIELHLHAPAERAVEAVALVQQVLAAPRFDEDEWAQLLAEEKADLLRARATPSTLVQLARQRAIYGEADRRGVRLRGTSRTLPETGLADAEEAWHRLVQPDRATLFVAADLDEAGVALALEPLKGWRAGGKPLPRPERTGAFGAGGVVVVDRPGSVQSALSVNGPRVEPVPLADPALRTMRTLLGGSFASRLNQNLREEHQYTYGASAFVARAPTLAYLGVRTQVEQDATAPALREIDKELAAIQRPPGEVELERARTYALLTLPDELETGRDITSELSWLHSEGADLGALQRLARGLPDVTADDVARAARTLLVGEGASWIVVGDEAAVRPALEEAGLGPVRTQALDELLGPVEWPDDAKAPNEP